MRKFSFLILAAVLFSSPLKATAFNKEVWSNLLHLSTSKPFIRSKDFYLSLKKTPESELKAHLKAFKSDKSGELVCRFPARFLYLKKSYDLDFDLSNCPGLSEFLERAPADKVELVFASESLTRPASAMGHTLLKISGTNSDGGLLEHNISFFTRMDDVDPFTLIIQSFLTGKDGFYTLSPYSNTRDHYLYNEGRNLFEYKLDLSSVEKKLLALHLYELKNVKFTYYFHGFNCSTLLRNILAVTYPGIEDTGHLWVTPLDVVRYLREHNHIKETKLRNTSAWQIKRLLLENNVDEIIEAPPKEANSKEMYTLFLFEDSKNSLNYEKGQIDRESYLKKRKALKAKFEPARKSYQRGPSGIKDPSFTMNDSSAGLFYLLEDEEKVWGLDILPVSHYLTNNLTGYDFESEVHLLSLRLGLTEESDLRLLKLTPLSIFSLVPHDRVTGGISWKVNLSYYDQENGAQNLYRAQLLAGKTLRVFSDLDLYFMAGGQANSRKESLLYAEAQTGLVLREIFNMKTHLYATHYRNFTNVAISKLSVDHGISINNNFIKLTYRNISTEQDTHYNEWMLSLHRVF